MKTILVYEIQKNVMQKICCFWFFDIFVGCWCARKSGVEMIVLMCECCGVDVFELFWCENRQVNKRELRTMQLSLMTAKQSLYTSIKTKK